MKHIVSLSPRASRDTAALVREAASGEDTGAEVEVIGIISGQCPPCYDAGTWLSVCGNQPFQLAFPAEAAG